MDVMTVLGPVAPDALGQTLIHEHVLFSLEVYHRGLVADGLAGSLVLAHDACYKTDLVAWGGDGYGHILRNIMPRLRDAGVADEAIRRMLVENPRRVLPLALYSGAPASPLG